MLRLRYGVFVDYFLPIGVALWSRRSEFCFQRNKMKRTFSIFGRWLFLFVFAIFLFACSQVGTVVRHSFDFSVSPNPKVDLLDYKYGTSNLPGTSPPKYAVNEGRPVGVNGGVSGPMRVGDSLYVKWRIKETSVLIEKRVDLRDRLPKDMTDQMLCFYISGEHLYIYIVAPEWPAKKPGPIGPLVPDVHLPIPRGYAYQILYPTPLDK